jgi:hypothetical protein
MPPSPPDNLARVEGMLRDILALTQRVIDHKHDWKATPADVELMHSVASLMGRSLAPETFSSVTAALAFLLMAKFSLEALATGIKDSPTA